MNFTEEDLEIIEDALIDWVGSMPTGISFEYHDDMELCKDTLFAFLRDRVKNRKKDIEK